MDSTIASSPKDLVLHLFYAMNVIFHLLDCNIIHKTNMDLIKNEMEFLLKDVFSLNYFMTLILFLLISFYLIFLGTQKKQFMFSVLVFSSLKVLLGKQSEKIIKSVFVIFKIPDTSTENQILQNKEIALLLFFFFLTFLFLMLYSKAKIILIAVASFYTSNFLIKFISSGTNTSYIFYLLFLITVLCMYKLSIIIEYFCLSVIFSYKGAVILLFLLHYEFDFPQDLDFMLHDNSNCTFLKITLSQFMCFLIVLLGTMSQNIKGFKHVLSQ